MRSFTKKFAVGFAAFLLVSLSIITVSLAKTTSYENPDTGYRAEVNDYADLLTDTEEQRLLEKLSALTLYGNMEFLTIRENPKSATSYNEEYYYGKYGNASGMILLIDMDNRKIIITTAGAVYNVISPARSDSITDKYYTYASDEEFYECAAYIFQDAGILLDGGKISEPMKHISNAVLAVAIGLLIGFWIFRRATTLHKDNPNVQLKDAYVDVKVSDGVTVKTHTTRRYDPVESSSSGGSGGGGGGGGGFSGGSGGHSF